MFNNLGLLSLLAHVLGDFYLQSGQMAEGKNKRFLTLVLHSAVYTGISALIIILAYSIHALWYAMLLGAAHFAVDLLKYVALAVFKRKESSKADWSEVKAGYVYAVDQGLHLFIILILSNIYFGGGTQVVFSVWPSSLFEILHTDKALLIKWLCALLLIGRPANITFLKLFSHFKPLEREVEKNKKVGATIGVLERILMLIFMEIGQYSAIGLVLTAKSIARYDKISENKEFGEYYLLGTLVSVLYAVVVHYVVF